MGLIHYKTHLPFYIGKLLRLNTKPVEKMILFSSENVCVRNPFLNHERTSPRLICIKPRYISTEDPAAMIKNQPWHWQDTNDDYYAIRRQNNQVSID